jgi:hypothetical protein
VSAFVFGFSWVLLTANTFDGGCQPLSFVFFSVLLTANTFDGNGDTKRRAERTRITSPAASR